MKKLFNRLSAPDHLSRSLLGGMIVVGFTNSLPLALASIIVIHMMSSAYHKSKNKQPKPNFTI